MQDTAALATFLADIQARINSLLSDDSNPEQNIHMTTGLRQCDALLREFIRINHPEIDVSQIPKTVTTTNDEAQPVAEIISFTQFETSRLPENTTLLSPDFASQLYKIITDGFKKAGIEELYPQPSCLAIKAVLEQATASWINYRKVLADLTRNFNSNLF